MSTTQFRSHKFSAESQKKIESQLGSVPLFASPSAADDTSLRASNDIPEFRDAHQLRTCYWCTQQLATTHRSAKFCSRKCRQSAFRIRRLRKQEASTERPLRFAYADPPYPGLSSRFYRNHPDFGGEVDHARLITSLTAGYDGWALSTGAYALREILPLCPSTVRVCAWVKPIGVNSRTFGLHNAWEPLIVVPGRRRRPGVRDWISAQPARGGGDLMGRKPIAFCSFLFDALGMVPGDKLEDLFPGTGIVARTWAEICRNSVANAGVNDNARQQGLFE